MQPICSHGPHAVRLLVAAELRLLNCEGLAGQVPKTEAAWHRLSSCSGLAGVAELLLLPLEELGVEGIQAGQQDIEGRALGLVSVHAAVAQSLRAHKLDHVVSVVWRAVFEVRMHLRLPQQKIGFRTHTHFTRAHPFKRRIIMSSFNLESKIVHAV